MNCKNLQKLRYSVYFIVDSVLILGVQNILEVLPRGYRNAQMGIWCGTKFGQYNDSFLDRCSTVPVAEWLRRCPAISSEKQLGIGFYLRRFESCLWRFFCFLYSKTKADKNSRIRRKKIRFFFSTRCFCLYRVKNDDEDGWNCAASAYVG